MLTEILWYNIMAFLILIKIVIAFNLTPNYA